MIRLSRFMLRPYTPQLLLVLVLVFGQSLAALTLPTLLADIVDKGIITGNTDYIWQTGGRMLLVAVGGTLASIIAIFFSSRIAVGFGRIIRRKLFTQVQQFS